MTYRELYLYGRARLREAGLEDPGVDAAWLCRHFFSLDRPGLAVHGGEICPQEKERDFLRAVEERAARRPLQYILGQWEFMGLTLAVGEGVLVPREDTGTLVEAVAGLIGGRENLRGADLCAGTGAVALGLCRLCPQLAMTCVELSPGALPWLEKNLAAYAEYGVRAVVGDVLRAETAAGFGEMDVIVSNPPYIARGILPTLQPEVQREPALALDGGEDGLRFYRGLAELWVPKLRPGGVLGVEIGEEQGDAVQEIFRQAGLKEIMLHADWNGLPRAVTARCG